MPWPLPPQSSSTSSTPRRQGAKALFDWAEYKFPELFPRGPQNFPLLVDGVNYTVRAYTNGNYLGLTAAGVIYGLGPIFTKGQLQSFGNIADYAGAVRADGCEVYPGSCDPSPSAGPANECVDPAMANLSTGLRSHLVYDISSNLGDGELTLDTVVDGPSTFKGMDVVKTTMTGVTTINASGFPITLTAVSTGFLQAAGNGLLRTLGGTTDSDSNFPSLPGGNKEVFDVVHTPPDVDVEFALQVGQSVTKTVNTTTTTMLPVGVPVTTTSSTDTYTFEAKEAVTVLGGSFDTCRYRQTTAGEPGFWLAWFIVGKGVPAKTTFKDGTDTTTLQLKPGSTYNGAPL